MPNNTCYTIGYIRESAGDFRVLATLNNTGNEILGAKLVAEEIAKILRYNTCNDNIKVIERADSVDYVTLDTDNNETYVS